MGQSDCMKKLILILTLALFGFGCFAQSAVLRNSFTTNALTGAKVGYVGSALVFSNKLDVRSEVTPNKYDWMIYSNGVLTLPAYNTMDSAFAQARGILFYNTNNTLASQITTWADHSGAVNTPELMFDSLAGIGIKAGSISGGSFARPFIQLGHNGNAYGAYSFLSYAQAGITDGIGGSLTGCGHSSSLLFRCLSTNGTGSGLYSDPGIMGVAGGDQTDLYGPGGNQSGRGKLGFYTVAPIFSGTSYASYPGIMVFEMGTNYLAMQSTNQLIGNGAGITNHNYALFQQVYAPGATHPVFASVTFTNIPWTTNGSGMSYDSGSAFTLSNHMIIVKANGAGTWRVRASTPFYNNVDNSGGCLTRLYRWNNTPTTLAQGQAVYQYSYSCPNSLLDGVVTFAAGDVFALQAYSADTANTQIGPTIGSSDNHVGAILELTRQ
jgi:hypothetical protein